MSAPQLSSGATTSGEASDAMVGIGLSAPEHTRYQSPELLGIGGMARVVAVHDRRLTRQVALKVPNPGSSHGVRLDASLAREARLAARLDHPGILPILDAGVGVDGHPYYTMPIVRGRSLADVLRDGESRDSRLRLLRRVLDACEAIGFAHTQGIVHCDVKPANLMFGESGGTRVLDWGLAHERGAAIAPAIGTPRYMSPEQALGVPADPRADVWSLGAILFELCEGRPWREADSPSEVLTRARAEATGEHDRPMLDPSVPPELAAIIMRAIARRPEERYPDARALAEDLGNFLDGRRVAAHSYRSIDLLLRVAKAWRVPLAVAGIALGVIAALIVLGMVALTEQRDRAEGLATLAEAAEERARGALAHARNDLGRALVAQAIRHSAGGERAEAELNAALSLAQRESPAARGVLAASASAPQPTLVSRADLPPCNAVYIDESATRLLCRDAESVSRWAIDREPAVMLWRHLTPSRVVSEGDGVVAIIVHAWLLRLLDAESGAFLADYFSACEAQVSIERGRVIASNAGAVFSVRLDDLQPELFQPCQGHGLMGAISPFSTDEWVALCEDGQLVRGAFHPAPQLSAQRATVLTGPGMALASASARDGRIFAGSALGEVVSLDVDSGAIVNAMPSGFSKVVALELSPDQRLVLVTSSDRSLAVLEPNQGLVRGRLPTRPARFARFSGDDVVIVTDRTIDRFHVARGPPSSFDCPASVGT